MQKNSYKIILLLIITANIYLPTFSAALAPSGAPSPKYTLYRGDQNDALARSAITIPTFIGSALLSRKYSSDSVPTLMAFVALGLASTTVLISQLEKLYNRESNEYLIEKTNYFRDIPRIRMLTIIERIELKLLYEEIKNRYKSLYTPWNWTHKMKQAFNSTYFMCKNNNLDILPENIDTAMDYIINNFRNITQ